MVAYILIYYAAMSLFAWVAYGKDKRNARKQRRRTSEAFLLAISFFGGSIGALFAMNCFRHKTRHLSFWIINLLGLAWQAALVIFLKAISI